MIPWEQNLAKNDRSNPVNLSGAFLLDPIPTQTNTQSMLTMTTTKNTGEDGPQESSELAARQG